MTKKLEELIEEVTRREIQKFIEENGYVEIEQSTAHEENNSKTKAELIWLMRGILLPRVILLVIWLMILLGDSGKECVKSLRCVTPNFKKPVVWEGWV